MKHEKSRYLKPIEDIRGEINNHFKPSLKDLLTMETVADIDPVFKKLESFIQENVRGISSSQLRNISDILKDEMPLSSLKAQRPRIAHMIAKQPREEAKKMIVLVDELIAQMDDTNYKGLTYFRKCFLTFHKYYEVLDQRRIKVESILRNVKTDLGQMELSRIFELYKPEAPVNQILDGLSGFLNKNSKGISSNQLRNVFDRILSAQSVKELRQLKPELAYAAGRQARHESVKFIYLVMELLKMTRTEEDRKVFVKTMETIVSLHKYEEAIRDRRINPEKCKEVIKENFGKHKPGDVLNMITAPDYNEIQEKLQKLVLVKGAKEGLKSSQFRRLYDKTIEAKTPEDFQLLRPLFLYTAARQSNEKAQALILFFVNLLRQINFSHLEAFKILMTDLLAYHRYFDDSKSLNIIQLK